MRGRPDIGYELSPSELVPGAKLTVTLVLSSDGETPYDKIDVVLRGRERSGDHAKPFDVPTHEMCLEKHLARGILAQGVHRLPVEFDLPAALAPSYAVRHVFDGARLIERVVEARTPPGVELGSDFATSLQIGLRVDAGDPIIVHLDPEGDLRELTRVIGIVSAALRRLAPRAVVGPYR